MRLTAAELHPLALRRLYHTRVAAAGGHPGGKGASAYLLLVLRTDNGLEGLGEVSDLEADWACPPAAELARLIADTLANIDLLDRNQAQQRLAAALPAELHPELTRLIRYAVDTALLDVAGKHFGIPAYELLGGRCRTDLPISWVAFIRSTDLLEDEIRQRLDEGFTAFKLKVGEDPELDGANIAAIRRLAGPQAYIKADASGQWQEDEAVEAIRRLAALGMDAIETPLRAVARSLAKDHPERVNDDPQAAAAALARLRRRVETPFIEHVADFDEAFALALLQHRAVDVFNVVPAQAGSAHRAQRLIHLAHSGGIQALLGSTVELGPGTAAALHLGLACPAVSLASDLVGPGLLEGDVTSPRLRYTAGHLGALPGPGLGLNLDAAALERYATETPCHGDPS